MTQVGTTTAISPSATSAKTVVVADDDHALRVAFAYVLRKDGYEVYEAVDGKEAVRLAGEHQVDLILMDIDMPKMNGVQAVRVIKGDPKTAGAKIIMLTAARSRELVAQSAEAGACGYVLKDGLQLNQLLDRIASLLNRNARVEQAQQAAVPTAVAGPAPTVATPAPATGIQTLSPDAKAASAQAELGAAVATSPGDMPAPGVIPAVQQVASDLTAPVDRETLQQLVGEDPGLALAVIQAANAGRSPVEDISGALDRVAGQVPQLVGRLARLDLADEHWWAGVDLGSYWKHSVIVAQVARELAEVTRKVSPGSAFLAGLLHDVGRILVQQTPQADRLADALEVPAAGGDTVCGIERQTLGRHHAEFGADYLAQYQLSQLVIEAIRWHHAPPAKINSLSGETKHLAIILQAANEWTKGHGHCTHQLDDVGPFPGEMLTVMEQRRLELDEVQSRLAHAEREVSTEVAFRCSRLKDVKPKKGWLQGAYVSELPVGLDPIAGVVEQGMASMAHFDNINALISTGQVFDLVVVNLLSDRASSPHLVMQRWTSQPSLQPVPLVLLGGPETERLSDKMYPQFNGVLSSLPVRRATLRAAFGKVT